MFDILSLSHALSLLFCCFAVEQPATGRANPLPVSVERRRTTTTTTGRPINRYNNLRPEDVQDPNRFINLGTITAAHVLPRQQVPFAPVVACVCVVTKNILLLIHSFQMCLSLSSLFLASLTLLLSILCDKNHADLVVLFVVLIHSSSCPLSLSFSCSSFSCSPALSIFCYSAWIHTIFHPLCVKTKVCVVCVYE